MIVVDEMEGNGKGVEGRIYGGQGRIYGGQDRRGMQGGKGPLRRGTHTGSIL